jgi:hypothetical protein
MENRLKDIILPNIGDMWDFNRKGICICTGLNFKTQTIDWFIQNSRTYDTQTFWSFRKFVKYDWVRKT